MIDSVDRFEYTDGTTFQDDDGTWIRVGTVPEEAKKVLAAHGQKAKTMPELVDGVIHYPDGRTKVLENKE